jgi:peptide/nickel transport system substrate-binding protein
MIRARRFRSVKVALVVASMAFLALWATGLAQSSSAQETLVLLLDDHPGSLDPALSMDQFTGAVQAGAYESLLRYDTETGKVEPLLATSWKSEDNGQKWIFNLRHNVTFSDGTPFNADAVVFTFQRMLKINQGPAYMFSALQDVKALDPYTVEFDLKHPYAPFLYVLAERAGGGILNPTAVKAHETNGDLGQGWLRDHMAGTGPYILQQWVPGQQIVMVRNPHYWRGWSGDHLDRIILKVTTQPSTQLLAVESGQADALANVESPHVPFSDLASIAKKPGVSVSQHTGTSELIVGFNAQHGPTANALVREALSYAIDYQGIIKNIYSGYAKTATGAIPAGIWGHDASLPHYTFDLAKAKSLLAQAGYPKGGFTLTFTVEPNPNYSKVVQSIASTYSQLGVNVKIEQMPWAEEYALLEKPDQAPAMYITGWYADYPDPDSYMYPLYDTASWGSKGFNLGYYSNKQVDQWLSQAQTTVDHATRVQLYKKAQEQLYKDAPVAWILNQSEIFIQQTRLKGFNYSPFTGFNYYAMYKTH